MKRVKRHKIKYEKPETSSSYSAVKEEHDLAYYIHDRVELMHQVFSVLKAKDLRAIAPECVRKLSIDDLEELCTEELLGISSKRLLAILDGAEPPSDTESSSQSSMEPMETISLDSISSDEELLSHGSKKKHKHKRRSSKSKKHKKKAEVEENNEETERSKASRAGLTVLELLELQARARAIRAQLQQEQANKKPEAAPGSSPESKSSDSEVEIKEEAAEVVEISSDDEKPKVEELEKALTKSKETGKEPEKSDKNAAPNVINNETHNNTENNQANNKSKKKKDKSKKKNKRKDSEREEAIKEIREEVIQEVRDNNETTTVDNNEKTTTTDKQTVTKRVNDLIITVPQSSSRKIKLNRNKVTVSVNNDLQAQNNAADSTKKVVIASTVTKAVNSTDSANKLSSVVSIPRDVENTVKTVVVETTGKNVNKEKSKTKDKSKSKAKKAKKKQKRQSIDEDQDEITIQLSDSEKMDLLEDFDSKKYDRVSSSSEDSESSSESSDSDSSAQNSTKVENNINERCANKNDIIDNNTESREVEVNVTDKIQTFVTDDEVNNKTSSSCSANLEKDLTTVEESGNSDSNAIQVTESECFQKDKNTDNKITITGYVSLDNDTVKERQIEITNIDDIPVVEDAEVENNNTGNDAVKKQDAVITDETNVKETSDQEIICVQNEECENKEAEKSKQEITDKEQDDNVETTNNVLTKEMSEGELSSNESSEVEALDVRPEVISISDEETPKKKKKKEKKSKKEKASNFRERGDQNFYKETDKDNTEKDGSSKADEDVKDIVVILDDDNMMEVYELSDDSSCYEVEGTVLSKEPTVEEIAALSAKIDEMEKEKADTRANHETVQIADENSSQCQAEIETEPIDENISWKDRYLGSTKVKTVLTTSNIFNVLRKKNKELKRKLDASKKEQKITQPQPEEDIAKPPEILVEGSIEHFNTLQGSNKYVNPVPDPEELREELAKKLREQEEAKRKEIEDQITGEMKKDAKQLLKMYKKLLKYNDVSKQKQKDPNKKKNKKRKKKEKEVATA